MNEEQNQDAKKDHWSAEAYNKAAPFVPVLTTQVLQYLAPKPHENILDIGSGDGELTVKIAQLCTSVIGLDSSTSFTKTANVRFASHHPNVRFYEHDCRRLNDTDALDGGALHSEKYDKIFSNAAMHWILRDSSTRLLFFSDVLRLLKPGGKFVFEMGGAGNVAEVHAALYSVLHHAYMIPMQQIRQVDPWFFPSEGWTRTTLEQAGFNPDLVEIQYRPTTLTPMAADGSGGLEGWLKLMGASFLECLDAKDRGDAVSKVCEVLNNSVMREADGERYLGYVRLRAVAHKPESQNA